MSVRSIRYARSSAAVAPLSGGLMVAIDTTQHDRRVCPAILSGPLPCALSRSLVPRISPPGCGAPARGLESRRCPLWRSSTCRPPGQAGNAAPSNRTCPPAALPAPASLSRSWVAASYKAGGSLAAAFSFALTTLARWNSDASISCTRAGVSSLKRATPYIAIAPFTRSLPCSSTSAW